MATLKDNRPVIADLLDMLGMAGADTVREVAAWEAVPDPDVVAELDELRAVIEELREALKAKGAAAGKLADIKEILESTP